MATCSYISRELDDINMPILTYDHIAYLNAHFTASEVKTAIFQIGPTKSPGIYGKSAGFYKTSKAVLSFLNSWNLLKKFNKTLIALIPKKTCLELVSD